MLLITVNWLNGLILTTTSCLIIEFIRAERLSSITPCGYPLLSETTRCGIDDVNLRKNVRVCDPDKAISMLEIEVIKNKLDAIYNRRNKSCICGFHQAKPCWFRFGFAFLRRMPPVESGIPDFHSRDLCKTNKTLRSYKRAFALKDTTRESIINYGRNFARLLRERWLMGECNEDILFFILLERPNQLIRRSSTLSYLTSGAMQQIPYIFASYGSLVRKKVEPFRSMPINDFLINKQQQKQKQQQQQQQRQRYVDPLQQIVESENANFENGYSLKVVAENLLDRFDATLSHEYTSPPPSHPQSHIPDWAMIVFTVCALLCVLMTVGLYLMQTSARRESPRNKPTETTRRWKAGFVGENMEGMPTGGVNLMQMLMQPSVRHNTHPTGNYA